VTIPERTLQDVLRELLAIRGVTSVAVAGADGTLVEGMTPVEGMTSGEDVLQALQELVPTALASSRALGGLLGDGAVQQTLVEYREGPVLLAPIDGGASEERVHVLVVGLADVMDLGRVRFQLKRRLDSLAEALRRLESP
jgi:predicted regulator of Ras-like GTPase activity (Roadblock/LC7/MglB family)